MELHAAPVSQLDVLLVGEMIINPTEPPLRA